MARRWFLSRAEKENLAARDVVSSDRLIRRFLPSAISYIAESREKDWLSVPYTLGEDANLASFLAQLDEQAIAGFEQGELLLPWQQVYLIERSADYAASYPLLKLPALTSLRPSLASRGSFSDEDFFIFISGWIAPDGSPLMEMPCITGAIIESGGQAALLSYDAWQMLRALQAFHQRTQKTVESNRICWARIRKHAKAARAQLTHFLESTVVVTPDKLELELRNHHVAGGKVVEIIPNFAGQPLNWIETFDRFSQVRDRYDVAHGESLTYVEISPEVQTVLKEIKRMPARRIAGDRAEAFLRNPFAALGPAANQVIDAAQFEQARDQAGISFACFFARVEETSASLGVSLCVQEGEVSVVLPFADPSDLEKFITKLRGRMQRQAQCCPWQGYDLEILGDTPVQLAVLEQALDKWRSPQAEPSNILDLSLYSQRIEGFGTEKPYHSPFIERRSPGDGWFPKDIIVGLQYTPDGSDGPERDVAAEKRPAAIKQGLVLKPNMDQLDHAELRGALSIAANAEPLLPSRLRKEATLKSYQREGIAWLQHLWSLSPAACRGALLADDMGLGKTIQLLALIARCLEDDSHIDPVLIVAPLSLLENWQQEIEKFFQPGALPVLTLYGSALREKRLPAAEVENELLRAGIARLLIPGWLGEAKIVLTTYETLRDLEFSLARQKWSLMVCDEAQKIKTPNAMLTRAAKKQNARFRIACTGTPVENTLTDLWCLFDFIQPGLLGSLHDFGNRYRRPIEAETEEEKARVEELRRLIEPQKLRRTKAEVAKDLPLKVIDPTCRALAISDKQRARYANAVSQSKSRNGGQLGLLQSLKALCSEADLKNNSPKLGWMLAELIRIRLRSEKVIVFCEFRELQRDLQRAIQERTGCVADIINGDSSAAAVSSGSRQNKIKRFQQTSGFAVIILSPLAVGFGVNIQSANHVIHFTRLWNPAREDQATDRAYRIGQTKDVVVYCPLVVAPDFVTFDARLDQLLELKRKLSHDMLNGCGDVLPADFSGLHEMGGGSPRIPTGEVALQRGI